MKKVITYGTYDLFHEGHYKLLQRAKALGDYLIVGVTTEHFDEARGKIKDYPLDVDEWLSYLSDRSQVNMFNLAIGYQQLKQAAYSERMDKFYAYLDSLKDEGNLLFHDKDEKIFN